ncbi:hypothetical protein KP509_15G033600 [Ceratopteris richardii]|nr:hypothetical protein KP509_15G033600 [Ceratopteris richardii]
MSKMEESQDVQDPMMAAKHISSSLGSPFFSFSVSKFNETSMYVSQMKFMRNFSLNTAFTTHPAITQFFAEGQVCYPNSYTAYECPEFAQAIYPFLIELYCAFRHLPGMHLALQETQKLLLNVRNGGAIDHSCLSVCQCFRLGAEALRSALNDSAHAPLELDKFSSSFVPFEELPYEDVCYVVLAQALKEQLQKSHRVVAILDAGMVAGVRKYWTSTVPDHVKALATECLILDSEESPNSEEEGSEGSMLDKPLIIVGAGAATLVGVTSSVHWGSASTAMKMFSFKIPTALKLAFIGAKKGSISSVIKAAHPITSSVFPSGKAFSAAKYAAGFKASVFNAVSGSANTRVAAHSVISTAQRVSLSAIRTTFYHVMQNRHRKGVGPRLWLSFGASVTACAGVLMFGEKFENVIEIVPEASSISSLCKGLNNLSHASNALMQIKDNQ